MSFLIAYNTKLTSVLMLFSGCYDYKLNNYETIHTNTNNSTRFRMGIKRDETRTER